MTERIVIDLKLMFTELAKLSELPSYIEAAVKQAGDGNEVILTGKAPIWMYLPIAHALHGKARKLIYRSPNTKERDVLVFDHNPY